MKKHGSGRDEVDEDDDECTIDDMSLEEDPSPRTPKHRKSLLPSLVSRSHKPSMDIDIHAELTQEIIAEDYSDYNVICKYNVGEAFCGFPINDSPLDLPSDSLFLCSQDAVFLVLTRKTYRKVQRKPQTHPILIQNRSRPPPAPPKEALILPEYLVPAELVQLGPSHARG